MTRTLRQRSQSPALPASSCPNLWPSADLSIRHAEVMVEQTQQNLTDKEVPARFAEPVAFGLGHQFTVRHTDGRLGSSRRQLPNDLGTRPFVVVLELGQAAPQQPPHDFFVG